LMTIVQTAISKKFLQSRIESLQLYRNAMKFVQNWILTIVANNYNSEWTFDSVELWDSQKEKSVIRKKLSLSSQFAISNNISLLKLPFYLRYMTPSTPIPILKDLIEDLRNMYETIKIFLQNNYSSWSSGRVILSNDQMHFEAYILNPLERSFNETLSIPLDLSIPYFKEIIKNFESLVNAHQPSHPDLWRDFIKYVWGMDLTRPILVVAKLRLIRGLYHRSMISVHKFHNDCQNSEDNYDPISLCHLCHEFLQFEKRFGTQYSYHKCRNVICRKLSQPLSFLPASIWTWLDKTLLENLNHNVNPYFKIQKVLPDFPTKTKRTNLKVMKDNSKHTVQIGSLHYSTMPTTIEIKNLNSQTQDMDIVDLLNEQHCGTILHARIIRDKSGTSKFRALVQFQHNQSLEYALTFNNNIQLHNRVLQITRSHQSAISIVPTKRFRIQPFGQGKYSKRNLQRKKYFSHNDTHKETNNEITSFFPRELARKKRIALTTPNHI